MTTLLLALSGCAWIGKAAHEADLAVWSVDFEEATSSCGAEVLMLTATTDRPDGEIVEVSVAAGGTSHTAQSMVAGGRLSWTLELPLDPSVTSLEVRLEGVRALRDEVLPLTWNGTVSYYADADADGFGAGDAVLACEPPAGTVELQGDCDDGDPHTHPGADERCGGGDEDCDGRVDDDPVDRVEGFVDADGDGVAGTPGISCDAVLESTDCDDHDPDVSPLAIEVCGGGDEDCDGLVDDDDPDLVAPDGLVDADGDGHAAMVAVPTCSPVMGLLNDDCDDAEPAAHPGRTEVCDHGIDNDCDGVADSADSSISYGPDDAWFPDHDGDMFGVDDNSQLQYACEQPIGRVANHDDCDDDDVAVGGPVAYYRDADGDGVYSLDPTELCAPPGDPWQLSEGSDCDDLDERQYPGAPELCNSADDDCDGAVDEDPAPLAHDFDHDGYGGASQELSACPSMLAGLTHQLGDCNDADPLIFPTATEACDGIDNDCDGAVDLGATAGFLPSSGPVLASWADVLADDGASYGVCGSVAWSGTLDRDLTLELVEDAVITGRLQTSGANLTLNGGRLAPGLDGASGGAVDVEQGELDLHDVAVFCSGPGMVDQGGAFAVSDGSLMVHGGRLSGCHAHEGGAVYAFESPVLLADVMVDGNTADAGGALYLQGNQGLAVGGATTFSSNDATDSGGALYLAGTNTMITIQSAAVARFESNGAAQGGAIYSASRQDLGSSTFVDNVAERGGAIYLEVGTPSLLGIFEGNEASVAGGAVYIPDTDAQPTTVQGTFTENHVGTGCTPGDVSVCLGTGGAIHAEAPLVVGSSASFSGNAAGEGGAVAAQASLFVGGGATDVLFDGNGSGLGGAISSHAGADLVGASFTGLGAGGGYVFLAAGVLDCQQCDTGFDAAVIFSSHMHSGPFDPNQIYTCDASNEVCTPL